MTPTLPSSVWQIIGQCFHPPPIFLSLRLAHCLALSLSSLFLSLISPPPLYLSHPPPSLISLSHLTHLSLSHLSLISPPSLSHPSLSLCFSLSLSHPSLSLSVLPFSLSLVPFTYPSFHLCLPHLRSGLFCYNMCAFLHHCSNWACISLTEGGFFCFLDAVGCWSACSCCCRREPWPRSPRCLSWHGVWFRRCCSHRRGCSSSAPARTPPTASFAPSSRWQ